MVGTGPGEGWGQCLRGTESGWGTLGLGEGWGRCLRGTEIQSEKMKSSGDRWGGQRHSYVNVPNGTDLCPLKRSRW